MTIQRAVPAAIVLLIVAIGLYLALKSNDDGSGESAGPPAVVVLARVEPEPLTRTIEAIANVQSAESVIVTVETSGRIAEVLFREGQRVARGQPLIRLVADQQAADLAAARAEAAELRQRLARQGRLVAEGAVPRGQVDDLALELRAAEARAQSLRVILDNTTVRAPFAGVIGLRNVSPGAFVNPGDELAAIEDDRSVRLRFTVPEAQLRLIRVGARVEARTPSIPDRTFEARITGIDTRLGSGQRTLEVEAVLPNGEGAWRAGMLAAVRIAVETVPETLTVPPIAVQVRGAVQFLFRAVEGCAERVEVTIGERRSDALEIVGGLAPGDLVIVEGFQDLSSGDPVRVAQRKEAEGEPRRGRAGGDAEPSEEERQANAEARQRCERLVQQRRQARTAEGAQQDAAARPPG